MTQFEDIQARSVYVRTRTITATDTATTTDAVLRADATLGAITVNLPTAASAYNTNFGVGIIYSIKKIDASVNTVTVDANGAETIDGSATQVIAVQYTSITIQSNGTSWDIL